MRKYIFLDNWTLGLLSSAEFRDKLFHFVRSGGYTALLSSLALVELYNPGWAGAKGNDRTKLAAQFYSKLPCVIVDPHKVWEAEIANRLDKLNALPVQLDLEQIDKAFREEALLRLLRRDKMFLEIGVDIQSWSDGYKSVKAGWLADVERIVNEACAAGNLSRDASGSLTDLDSHKEQFLFSLDLRHARPGSIDTILAYQAERRAGAALAQLSAVRLSSLLFWYSYVAIDPANRMKWSGSDIGDIYHLSLLPYCGVFTADKAMARMLRRIKEPVEPLGCAVLNKPTLENAIGLEKAEV